jgi:transcription-repair coupling factor (superfamily II helicase)
MELLPGESNVNLELLTERLRLVRRLREQEVPAVTVGSIHALMQAVPQVSQLDHLVRVVLAGDSLDLAAFVVWLHEAGYARVETIESPGEFTIRGGIVDIFSPGAAPARLDLFGDEVEALYEIDLDTLASDRKLASIEIARASAEPLELHDADESLCRYLPGDTVAILAEMIELNEQGRSYMDRAVDARGLFTCAEIIQQLAAQCHAMLEVNQYSPGSTPQATVKLPVQLLPPFAEDASDAVVELGELADDLETMVLCQNDGEAQRMKELLEEFAPQATVAVFTQYLHRGFIWEGSKGTRLALVPHHELLHRYSVRRRLRLGASRAMDTFLDLQPGDLVVHRDHGIARFVQLQNIKSRRRRSPQEFLTLEFAGNAKLHVPASKIELVQKYIGSFKGRPELSRLGGVKWGRQKAKVQEAVRDLATEMLRIQAARESMPGIRYPADTTWQREFEAEFPYEETDDQLAAAGQVKRDMSDPRPMDRLICGDVGFGKTEVAIRAAFKAAEYGKQVALLVPTTVLAEQHERTFRQRFADYPFRIESISRFKTKKHQRQLLEAVRKGQVDIIIGTHRLLSKDVRFADLGLVIIDEEQRFGVEHKQRLLEFRMTVDVLTLSATPIPRTLHMAMLGLRDISSLATAPLDRRAIVTEVITPDPQRVKHAIERELARDGQVFYVHNRVYNIKSVADQVQQLVPEARVLVGHGQMPSRQLESVMLKFMRREVDVLICTTIIESGIDIPTANTMFIDDAHMFGLSELHQLRGRVGRYKHRAYCYLILPPDRIVSEVALRRLKAIEQFSMLGAGFKIALRDLEIRGAGNLLGAEQSGHIAVVGYEMYCQLLERAVSDLKEQSRATSLDTTVDLAIAGALPKGYIPSDIRRLEAYRRISRAESIHDLHGVERDLASAYGSLPPSAQTLVQLAQLRVLAAAIGIRSITLHEEDVIFATEQPQELQRRMADAKGTLRLVGQVDRKGLAQVYYRPPANYLESDTILTILNHRLRSESESAEPAIAR